MIDKNQIRSMFMSIIDKLTDTLYDCLNTAESAIPDGVDKDKAVESLYNNMQHSLDLVSDKITKELKNGIKL